MCGILRLGHDCRDEVGSCLYVNRTSWTLADFFTSYNFMSNKSSNTRVPDSLQSPVCEMSTNLILTEQFPIFEVMNL